MRQWINLIEGSHTPPKREDGDDKHYDALEKTGFFGEQAAGCIPMARDTGRILLVHRSSGVMEPGTWGNVGGAHHADETPEAAALRELHEETGYSGPAHLIPLFIFKRGSFRYCNYLAIVNSEFVPELGWEADEYKWCTLDDLPHPLHFGIEAVLNDPKSQQIISNFMEKLR